MLRRDKPPNDGDLPWRPWPWSELNRLRQRLALTLWKLATAEDVNRNLDERCRRLSAELKARRTMSGDISPDPRWRALPDLDGEPPATKTFKPEE